jgi:hypothetical protein
MDNVKKNRRHFLIESGAFAGVGWLALNTPLLLATGEAAGKHRANNLGWVNITDEEAETLSAIVDQIIPPDDTPGASEAGVVYFIDLALGSFESHSASMLRSGLADLEAATSAAHPGSTGFSGLDFEQQASLLQTIETTPFFEAMIRLTDWGMFAMSSWGGNRNDCGWAMLGFVSQHGWQPPFGYYDALADAGEADHADS